MKKILIVLAVLFVLFLLVVGAIVGVGFYAFSQIDTIAKEAIQRGGTYATQTETTVDTVEVGLFEGTFAMTGFTIGNPEGFDTDHFLAMGGTSVKLDPQSIASDTIRVPTVTLNDIDVILDKGASPANYNQILNSLQRFESGEKPKTAPENAGGPRVVVDSLVLDTIDIHLANMPGVGLVASDIAINIPRIELKDVGKDEPMSTSELINLIVKTVMTAAVEAGGGIIPADVLGELGNGLKGLASLGDMGITAIGGTGEIIGEQLDEVLSGVSDELGKVGEGAAEAVEDATKKAQDEVDKAVNDASEKVKEGLGNLLGGKKDDP